ncbi:MAG: hypothetical protein K1X65_03540 [Caldilineales bacterium]|nr:hypothetical protein [Caldilineales bacterium]
MNLLRRLFSSSPAAAPDRGYRLHVRCRRCGEVIPVRINLDNDLSVDYDSGGYSVHKVIVGSGQNRCFQRIELDLRFDPQKKLIHEEVVGGEVVRET